MRMLQSSYECLGKFFFLKKAYGGCSVVEQLTVITSFSQVPITPMLWRRSRSGVSALRKLLYVVGGYDGVADLSSAECYNPLTNNWTNITPMGTKRSCLGICAFDGLLYVCGGYDGASCLSVWGINRLMKIYKMTNDF